LFRPFQRDLAALAARTRENRLELLVRGALIFLLDGAEDGVDVNRRAVLLHLDVGDLDLRDLVSLALEAEEVLVECLVSLRRGQERRRALFVAELDGLEEGLGAVLDGDGVLADGLAGDPVLDRREVEERPSPCCSFSASLSSGLGPERAGVPGPMCSSLARSG